jgi:hypothetical protein
VLRIGDSPASHPKLRISSIRHDIHGKLSVGMAHVRGNRGRSHSVAKAPPTARQARASRNGKPRALGNSAVSASNFPFRSRCSPQWYPPIGVDCHSARGRSDAGWEKLTLGQSLSPLLTCKMDRLTPNPLTRPENGATERDVGCSRLAKNAPGAGCIQRLRDQTNYMHITFDRIERCGGTLG